MSYVTRIDVDSLVPRKSKPIAMTMFDKNGVLHEIRLSPETSEMVRYVARASDRSIEQTLSDLLNKAIKKDSMPPGTVD